MMKLKSMLAICLGITVLCGVASAAGDEQSGWSAGLTMHSATLHRNDDMINDSGLGFRLFGQYRFNRWFALEGAYFNNSNFLSSATSAGGQKGEQLFRGGIANAVAFIPTPIEGLEFFARGGFSIMKTRFKLDGTTTESRTNNGATLGGGFAVTLTEHLRFRSAYDWYHVRQASLWSLGIGLEYHF